MGFRRYHANGFYPYNNPPARRQAPVAASINIVKGDALQDNGSGYITNAGTAFAATHMGIAAADCNNSSGAAAAKYVEYYPLDDCTQYIVPVAANAVITRTVIGTIIDLEANDDVDVSDAVTTGIGFRVDDFDASAAAVAVNTYGYAIGHFELGLSAQT
jgi:hypothetical protein